MSIVTTVHVKMSSITTVHFGLQIDFFSQKNVNKRHLGKFKVRGLQEKQPCITSNTDISINVHEKPRKE
jgi:hypothetical protein